MVPLGLGGWQGTLSFKLQLSAVAESAKSQKRSIKRKYCVSKSFMSSWYSLLHNLIHLLKISFLTYFENPLSRLIFARRTVFELSTYHGLKNENQYMPLLSHICSIVNGAFSVKLICMQNWHLRAIKSNSEWRQNHFTGKISTRYTFSSSPSFPHWCLETRWWLGGILVGNGPYLATPGVS